MKRIGMILDRPFPTDDRVEKEALSLIEAGFDVHLLCFTFGELPAAEIYKSIRVKRVYMSRFYFNKLSALILLLPFYNRFWLKQIRVFVKQQNIEILHIHDLPLVGAGLKIRKEFDIPVLADMHEDYADWIVNTEHLNTVTGKIIKKYSPWKKYEKNCLQDVDFIIAVSELLIDKMQNEHQLNHAKMIYVPNTPDVSKFVNVDVPNEIKSKTDNKFTIIYAGGIDYLRGLQNVIPLIKELKKTLHNIRLIIVGNGSYKLQLQELVKSLNLVDEVIFAGWLNMPELAAYLNSADVGIYPQLTYSGIELTLPTKLYQYLAAGIPVISSNHTLPRNFLETNQCGFALNFEEPSNKFVEKITYLYNNPSKRLAMGNRGREVIIKNYNWDKTVRPLIYLYQNIN